MLFLRISLLSYESTFLCVFLCRHDALELPL
jgi:hypothetical protein